MNAAQPVSSRAVKATPKSVLHNVRAPAGRVASALSFSVHPRHIELIRSRERELNIGKSLQVQLLLDVEEREGLLRKGLIARLTEQPPAKSSPPPSPSSRRPARRQRPKAIPLTH